MKEFTSTELRVKSSDVYNEVHKSGMASIKHRDRPEMILITKDMFADQIKKAVMIK